MFIRQKLSNDKAMGIAIGLGLIAFAAIALAIQFWPQKKANLSLAFYTDNDGGTWFKASAFQIAPFDHDGKVAVMAQIYSYDNGSKKFCAYMVKYTPEAKKQLETAIADAQARGQPPSSVALFNDRGFLNSGMMVKSPGGGNPWIPFTDPRANQIMTINSPDGTAVDTVFVY
jgi:hypothetical protein